MGYYRNTGRGDAAFAYYVPDALTALRIDTVPFCTMIGETEAALVRLNASTETMSDQQVRTALDEEARDSWMLSAGKYFSPFGLTFFSGGLTDAEQREIADLSEASLYAVEALAELPLCWRLLRNAHYLMCRGPRYEKRYPGEFRSSPVWIGREGSSLNDALFVPPVDEAMSDALSELERFIHEESSLHPLVRAALIHAQFETIHPFIDANGRAGRLLNTLFLLDSGVIRQPLLRWSRALGRFGDRYGMELQRVRETGSYESWIGFYLLSLKEAAADR